MPIAYYEFKDEKSNKFWEIEVKGKTVTVRYGRIGTDGQTNVKSFASPSEAVAHAGKVTAEKTKKGYKEAKRAISFAAKATGAKKKASSKQSSQPAPDWKAVKVPAAGLKALSRKGAKSNDVALRPDLAKALRRLKAGTLLIDEFVNLEEVRAVLRHANASKIEAIQLTSWSDDAREVTLAQYKKRANELNELDSLQGFGLPDFIFDVAYFFIEATAGLWFQAKDQLKMEGLENLAESYLLQRVLNSKAKLSLGPEVLLRDRYAGLHDFYYVPLACYHMDNLTWGLAYDFEKRGLFDGLVYHYYDMALVCYWHEALEKLQDSLEEYAEEMEIMGDDEDSESFDEEQQFVGHWLASRLMVGYLRQFKVLCACKNIRKRERQIPKFDDEDAYWAVGKESGAQVLLPIIRMPGLNRRRIDAILDAIVALGSDDQGRTRAVQDLDKLADPAPIERELADVLRSGTPEDRWDRALSLVRTAAEAGNPGLALHAADRLADLEDYAKAAQLLQVLPDAVCPPFIKAICTAHAKTSDVA